MIAQSPTSLSTFLTCPRQYEAKYVTKEVVFQDTNHTRFGTLVHKAIEDRLMLDTPLPPMLSALEPTLGRMSDAPGIAAEVKLARTADGKACGFFDKEAYMRCIVDALMDFGDTVVCVDWKTGKKRDHQTQHNIIRYCAEANYPDAKTIVTIFVYLFAGQSDSQTYHRDKGKTDVMIRTMMDISMLRRATEKGDFPPKPSGLCKRWCDVLSCPHNGRHS